MIELYEWEDEPNAEDDDKDQPKPETLEKWKWKHLREAIHPDPDDDSAIDYACPESLREIYKDSGLQVIVKMARIELTPEKPDFPAGGWHVSEPVPRSMQKCSRRWMTTNTKPFR